MIFFSRCKAFALRISRSYSNATPFYFSSTLLHFLQLSAERRSLILTQQSHGLVLTTGFSPSTYLATSLISAYAACKSIGLSKLVFDSFHVKNIYLWNTLIAGYVKNGAYGEAFELFSQMCSGNVVPDDYTLSTLSKIASESRDLDAGRVVHAKIIRMGFIRDTIVANSLMSVYCKCGNLTGIEQLFEEMPQRNITSWNVLIMGCASLNDEAVAKDIWQVVRVMQGQGVRPDAFTVSSILPFCAGDAERFQYGRELHCYILRNELESILGSDIHLSCCLIDMYAKNNKMDVARWVFDSMRYKNVYAWTAMVNGYVKNGASEEALSLFRKMQFIDHIEPNDISLISILPACMTHASFIAVREVHGFSMRKGIDDRVAFANALIDEYSKSGDIVSARRIFDSVAFKDAISWSSMISGYGIHGKGEEAILLYNKMLMVGIKPDMVTLVGVLSACCRSGLVNEGLNIYSSAVNECGIEPTVEICACVVDILGRSNQLDRALDFINNMHVEAGPSVWGALVNASVMHANHKMRNLAYGFLIRMEPENPSNYVSLSNLYASSRKWSIVAGVRKVMQERGLRKEPGCSWIMINGTTNCFYVADKMHNASNSIYEMLDSLLLVMKGTGSYAAKENLI